jgi:molybdopterin-guanine dinucleotide biosynthesis protein A
VDAVAGVILAGGRATRMGGRDKAFLVLDGRPLVEHAVARMKPQVAALAINSNADPEQFSACAHGVPLVADLDDRRSGPLAGVLAGLRWAASLPRQPLALVSAAVDTPFFPADLVERLVEAAGDGGAIAVAACHGARHPTFALWPLALAGDLARFIDNGSLKVTDFIDMHNARTVDFAPSGHVDPFFNINAPADLARAEAMLRTLP